MIYLSNLRSDVRNSGDYVNNPFVKDPDLNLWLNQAFSKIWIRVCSLGEDLFSTETTLNLVYDEKFKKYYGVLPTNYFSLQEIYLKKGNDEPHYMERASSIKGSYENKDYSASDQIEIFYAPDAPELLESAPENPEDDYQFNIPKFWKYTLIDYAIKRAKMKKKDIIAEIDVEQLVGFADIISAARNTNNHFPARPTPVRNDYSLIYGDNYRYSYFPLGRKLYLV